MGKTPEGRDAHLSVVRRYRWLWVVVAVLALAGVTLVLLPYGLQWGLQKWLIGRGALAAKIGDVDFNPFTGSLVVRELNAHGTEAERLEVAEATVRVDWWLLWSRRLQVQGLALEGVSIDVRQAEDGSWAIGSLLFPPYPEKPEAEERKPWEFGTGAIDLRDIRMRYSGPRLHTDLTILHAHMDAVESWKPEAASPFDARLQLNGGSVVLQGEARPFGRESSVTAGVHISRLPLAWLGPLLEGQDVRDLDGVLEAETSVHAGYRPEVGGLLLNVEGTVRVQGLQGAVPAVRLRKGTLSWEGGLRLTGSPASGKPALVARGELTGANVELEAGSPALRIRQQGFSVRGAVEYGSGKGPGRGGLQVKVDASAAGLRVDDRTKGLRALVLEELGLRNVKIEGADRIEADRLHIGKVKVLERPSAERRGPGEATYTLTLKELLLERARVKELARISVARARMKGAEGWLARNPQGKMELAQWFAEAPASRRSAGRGEAWRPTFRIGQVEISGDSRLVFMDRSVRPTYRVNLSSLAARLSNLDTGAPLRQSPVELSARVGKYSALKISGSIAPFAKRASMDLRGRLEAIELPPLTSYVARHAGYRLRSGHLDADLEWRVDQGILDAEADLLLSKLEIERLERGEEDVLTQLLGMPANKALSLLRDKEDNIRLRLPIEGDVQDPRFRLHDVILKATGKAVQKGVLAYYTPLGVTLLTGVTLPVGATYVAGKLVSLVTALRFKAVEFAPLEYGLAPEAKSYLDRMAELLRERPKARLVLCGKVTSADIKALREEASSTAAGEKGEPTDSPVPLQEPALSDADREQLLELAKQRAYAVKDYLTAEGGIEAERLFVCRPQVEEEDEGTPRVEVSI